MTIDTRKPAQTPENRSAFFAELTNVEWRQAGNGKDFTLTGTAAVFNHWSEDLGGFRERIMSGAFTNVLKTRPDVRLLYNHDVNFVLARTKAGTLELTEEADGLRVWARVAPTSYAKDLQVVMERGDVDQMSFAFGMDPENGAEDRWYEDENGEIRRDVVAVSDLYDVSPVTFPAYPDTSAAMRELRSACENGRIEPRKAEKRADVASLGLLMDMYECGQQFVALENMPDDAADVAAMNDILARLEALMQVEAAEPNEGEPLMEMNAARQGKPPRNHSEAVTEPPSGPREASDAVGQPSVSAPADPAVVGDETLADLRAASKAALARERETYLRLVRKAI